MLMVWYKVVMVQKPQAEGVNKNKPSETNIEFFFYIIIFSQVKLLRLDCVGTH